MDPFLKLERKAPIRPSRHHPVPPDRFGWSQAHAQAGYEDFTLADLTAIRNLLRGGSVIDWHRLYFTDRDEVDRFLRVNELDPRDEDDMRRLAELRELAVEYLERHLGFQIPDEVAHGVPPRDLLLIASQKGKRRAYACIVLKVMHVMHHLAGRELLTKLPVSDDQIFHLVEEKVLRTVEELKSVGCQVVEFEWSRKHADSLITKLLAKKESIAADVYDKLRFPHDHQLRGAAGVRDARAGPAPGPVQLRHPRAVGERHHQDPRDAGVARRRCASSCPRSPIWRPSPPTRSPSPQNEFSGPGYRVINFVADLPVRMDKFLCRAPDDPLFAENGTIVFVLTEFQIIDARTAENNERGENSHEKYKERQFARVKARLMHGMKDERPADSAGGANVPDERRGRAGARRSWERRRGNHECWPSVAGTRGPGVRMPDQVERIAGRQAHDLAARAARGGWRAAPRPPRAPRTARPRSRRPGARRAARRASPGGGRRAADRARPARAARAPGRRGRRRRSA